MSGISRRTLLASTACLSGTSQHILGANERINIGVIGFGWRGGDHIREFAQQPDCRIAAHCDVDEQALNRAVAQVQKLKRMQTGR